MMEQAKHTTHIFWTGGLDSTFRLIQLLMTTESPVQPHYIVDSQESTGFEIDTMNRIRAKICQDFPELRPRFLPTMYVHAAAIGRDEEIRAHVEELRRRQKVEEQYHMMSNYCLQFGIDQVEVSLTKLSGEKETFLLFRNSPAFKYFLYPTLHYSKTDMYHIAREKGWDTWLDMTTFCRRPKVIFRQCGSCSPCVETVMEGLGSRLHPVSRIKARIKTPFWKYRHKHHREKSKTT